MITALNVTSIYVLNKDEALDFYVNKLGLERAMTCSRATTAGSPFASLAMEPPRSRLSSPAHRYTMKRRQTESAS